jgi:hypothetical protein
VSVVFKPAGALRVPLAGLRVPVGLAGRLAARVWWVRIAWRWCEQVDAVARH